MTQLADALRAKFKDGRAALRALGVDENLLDGEGDLLRKHADKFIRLLVQRYGSDKAVLRKLAMDESMLTEPEHMKSDPRGNTGGEVEGGVARRGEDNFGLRSSRDNLPPKVETMPEENTDEDEFSPEEEQSLQDYATDMRKRGDDAEVIDRAMRMARDFLRRHRGHADDRLPQRVDVQDKMPLRGGRFDRARFNHDEFGVEPPHGLDSSRREINEIHRQVRRFGPEAGCRPMRASEMAASDQVQTMAKQARTMARYPGLARIEEA
jgi:hypothetical protein